MGGSTQGIWKLIFLIQNFFKKLGPRDYKGVNVLSLQLANPSLTPAPLVVS